MTEQLKRKRGGQPGNQNARKHGYFSKVITDEEKLALPQASQIKDIDYEIALLRVKIRSILKHDADNVSLLTRALSTLSRLVSLRHRLEDVDDVNMGSAVGNALKDMFAALGIDVSQISADKPAGSSSG